MSFDTLGDLNWLAVAAATVAYFALGGIWYARAVFGKAWMKAGGVEIPEGQQPGPAFYIVPLIANFLAVLATAMVARSTASTTFGDAIVLGIVLSVGFAVALTLLGAIFDNKPQPGVWFAINSAYHVVGLLIVAVIVTLWD